MRSALRLLANVKSPRYLQPFEPTGIVGLVTHPHPRPTLIYLYKTTLQKLKAVPETSVYRQSTEALTRQRLQIVESAVPAGFDAWLERVKKTVADDPERFKSLRQPDGSYVGFLVRDGSDNPRGQEWDGDNEPEPISSSPIRTKEEEAHFHKIIDDAISDKSRYPKAMKWENEPPLEAEQYADLPLPSPPPFFFFFWSKQNY